MTSVIQEWVQELGLRMQGVLVSAVRGCDTAEKESPGKTLVRYYRGEILVPADGDLNKSVAYMKPATDGELLAAMKIFVSDWDHLPLHYVMHMMFASEILGYYHHVESRRLLWNNFYREFVRKLHLNVESKFELEMRLNCDTQTFKKNQELRI